MDRATPWTPAQRTHTRKPTRGDLHSRVPPFRSTRRVPLIMAFGGFMNSREPPAHMPTGTPRCSSTTLLVLRLLLPGDPSLTTPPGTKTLRDPHQHRHRRPRVPEPDLLQRPELINGSPNTSPLLFLIGYSPTSRKERSNGRKWKKYGRCFGISESRTPRCSR